MKHLRYALSGIGAAALIGGVMTNAFASGPGTEGALIRSAAPRTTIRGDLYVNRVLHVQNNASFYGHLYAHNQAQVWKGLTVRTGGVNVLQDGVTVAKGGLTVTSGGIKADSAILSGPLQAGSGSVGGNLSVTGNLTAGTVNGSTLTLTGKMSSIGVDAGNGAITTTGGLTAGSVSTAGTVTASGLSVSGNVSLANATLTGNVNFTGATVTGLTLSGANIPSLSVGSTAGTSPPLTISENSKTAALGVDTAGNLSATSFDVAGPLKTTGATVLGGDVTIAGDTSMTGGLTIASSKGVVTNVVTGPPPSGSTTPGPIAIQGSPITLSGATLATGGLTLANNSNLSLSSSSSGASHVLANGDKDVAGTIAVTISGGHGTYTLNPGFATAYNSTPLVYLTPATSDPSLGGSVAPTWYVTSTSSNFTVNVSYPGGGSESGIIYFNYLVVGA